MIIGQTMGCIYELQVGMGSGPRKIAAVVKTLVLPTVNGQLLACLQALHIQTFP
jgi:hypothetical protein